MDLAIILTLLGTTITIIGFVYSFLRNFKFDIQGQILRLDNDIKSLRDHLKSHALEANQRTDRLYQMFIDLLKSQKNP